jgi:carbon-monoxide dehydrogenase medium subunit
MKPAQFELLQPETRAEAVALLGEAPDDTVILAGGQSLVPLMNMRFVVADRVLDLNGVAELAYVERANGHLAVGAMTRHRTAETDPRFAEHVPLVAAAEPHVGYVSVRNRGTMGGSLSHADTVAELACVATALDAGVVLESVRGRRVLPVSEFLVGNLMNAREPDELVVELQLPVARPGSRSGFAEFARKTGDFPLVTAAVQLDLDRRRCTEARIALGGLAPTPSRLTECEAMLAGAEPTGALLDEVAAHAAAIVEAVDTPFVSGEYRRVLTRVVLRRALEQTMSPTRDEE